MSDKGFSIDTPAAINFYGLLVLKMDLKLASHGIKRRGYNARTLAKQVTGLKTNDCDKLIAAVEAIIEEAGKNPEVKAGIHVHG